MISRKHRCNRQHGLTLVELLVVLAILAGLVTVTTVSVETAGNQARAEKTSTIGRQVMEDLERSEGLSFVSDFGRLPDRNEVEIKFLFWQTVLDATSTSHPAETFELRTLTLPTPDPTVAGLNFTSIQTAFGTTTLGTAPTLGAGWRGPYCQITGLRGEEGEPSEFLDGWNHEWAVLDEDDTTVNMPASGRPLAKLRSLGRDGAAGGVDWQDEDRDIPLRRDLVTNDINLQINVVIRDTSGGMDRESEGEFDNGATKDLTIKVHYFAPEFGAYLLEETPTGINPNIASVQFTRDIDSAGWQSVSDSTYNWHGNTPAVSGDAFNVTLDNLTIGHRLIFLYALGTPDGGTQTHYAGGARLVHLKPGANSIDYTLTELN